LNRKLKPSSQKALLTEQAMLQGGKGKVLLLALGDPLCVVAERNFRTHQSRDQGSLLVKQSKGKIK
jgi:hypothetical protein